MSRLSALVVASILIGCALPAQESKEKEKVLDAVQKLEQRLQRVDLYLNALRAQQTGAAETAEVSELKTALADAQKRLDQSHATAKQHSEESRVAHEALKAMEARLRDSQQELAEYAQMRDELAAQVESKLADMHKRLQHGEDVRARAADLERALQAVQAESNNQREQAMRRLEESHVQLQRHRDELDQAHTQRAHMEARLQEALAKLADSQAHKARGSEMEARLREKLEETLDKLRAVEDRSKQMHEALNHEQEHRAALEHRMAQVTEHAEAQRREFEMRAADVDKERQNFDRSREAIVAHQREAMVKIDQLTAENHELRRELERVHAAKNAHPAPQPQSEAHGHQHAEGRTCCGCCNHGNAGGGGLQLHIENHDDGDVQIHIHGAREVVNAPVAPRRSAPAPTATPRRSAVRTTAPTKAADVPPRPTGRKVRLLLPAKEQPKEAKDTAEQTKGSQRKKKRIN